MVLLTCLIDEETAAQRGRFTYPRSQSFAAMAPVFNPEQTDHPAHRLNTYMTHLSQAVHDDAEPSKEDSQPELDTFKELPVCSFTLSLDFFHSFTLL